MTLAIGKFWDFGMTSIMVRGGVEARLLRQRRIENWVKAEELHLLVSFGQTTQHTLVIIVIQKWWERLGSSSWLSVSAIYHSNLRAWEKVFEQLSLAFTSSQPLPRFQCVFSASAFAPFLYFLNYTAAVFAQYSASFAFFRILLPDSAFCWSKCTVMWVKQTHFWW